ncbi:MAG: isoleucine--tRNA ligase [Gemmatimonadales bacterium]
MAFLPLDEHTPDQLERALLDTWAREGLFHRTLDATADGTPFVFYEGPPTANGKPGIHHVFARTIKDMVCRYHAMQGRQVTRTAGWDTHGLPVEIEVEKRLNLQGKQAIERLGVAEFNRQCRESVFTYKSEWEALSNRIGYWLDYDRAYVTFTNNYIESVWWLLKQLHSKDLLYEGHKVLPYCARCGTTLSSHELALGYKDHASPSIYALFRLKDPADDGRPRHLLAWTTTPWTLPSNVALAVNPAFTYVELDIDGRRVIVEKSIAGRKAIPGGTHGKMLGEFPVLAEMPGTALVGQRYAQLLEVYQPEGDAWRVVAGDFVTDEDGTGVVHMSPAHGADDYATVTREGLAFFALVNAQGRFEGTTWDALNGQHFLDANAIIAERLGVEGKLFGRYEPQGHTHSYPFCWRCDSPLLYYARSSWFVRTTAFRDRMLDLNGKVAWQPPEVGIGRFGEWLENNVDWALSRDRYWGTPLPVWRCETDPRHVAVIGSFAELAERLGRPLGTDFDPHKPFIDEATFACACGSTMRRVPEVIDAWFDSGAMPVAQWHYPFENVEEFERQFPADFICEGLDQTRGWFYSLLAIAAGVFDQPAYRHVIVNGLLLDAEGRKMSKRVGNVVNPWEVVERFGADAVRLYLLAGSQVWLAKRFDAAQVQEVVGGSLNRLRNTYGFFALYAGEWTPAAAPAVAERPVIDRWMLARWNAVVRDVRAAWDAFDMTTGIRALLAFCDDDLSNWYVRVNRARFWAPDTEADPAALATLHEVLSGVCRLMAPAAPFLSDALYRRLHGASVHLAGVPEATPEDAATTLTAMDAVRRLATLARAAREEAGLRVRQPLATLRVAVPFQVRGPVFDGLLELLAREVNVKRVEPVASDADLVRLTAKANFRSLGKRYGKQTPEAARVAQALDVPDLRRLEAGHGIEVSSGGQVFIFEPDDVTVVREVTTDWLVQSDGPYVAALNPIVDEALRAEGLGRELVNRIQRLRKEAGYQYDTRIAVGLTGPADVLGAATTHGGWIGSETLARHFTVGQLPDGPDVKETVDIDGRAVTIALARA